MSSTTSLVVSKCRGEAILARTAMIAFEWRCHYVDRLIDACCSGSDCGVSKICLQALVWIADEHKRRPVIGSRERLLAGSRLCGLFAFHFNALLDRTQLATATGQRQHELFNLGLRQVAQPEFRFA